MSGPQHLTFKQQLELFEQRGMIINKNDINKIQVIGYYRIKQFASPIAKKCVSNDKTTYDYTGINFSDVLKRYYQDKNLRSNLLHALEKVEVALKTRVSFLLGRKYGAFGYLDFSNWCNKSKYSKFTIEERQYFFKKNLKKSISHSCSEDVQNRDNLDSDGFPSIWLAGEVLTFGEIVRLVEIMSVKNKTELAKSFNCTHKELLSWMKCLNFVRNICAHNSNIIDMQLGTKPVCKEEWKERLYMIKNNHEQSVPSNKLAIVLLILEHFILTINEKYAWRKVHNNISRITDGKEKNAKLLGFSDKESANKVFNKLYN